MALRRCVRFLGFAIFLYACWLAMMVVHEIGHVLSACSESRWEELPRLSAGEVIRAIEQGATDMSEHACSSWGKRARVESLRAVATRVFTETDVQRLTRLLRVFQHRGLPEFDTRLLDLAVHPNQEVCWRANLVLANHEHPDVREYALNCARSGRNSMGELRLFCRNCRCGDWRVIHAGLTLPDNEMESHSLFRDLLDIYESNAAVEAAEPAVLAYEHTPCSLCRERAVEMLHGQSIAPAWVLEECRFDADTETRKIVA